MSGNFVILIAIGICTLILLWVLFEKQINYLLTNTIGGVIIIYFVNSIWVQGSIGINVLTLSISALLGIPGIVMLYILKLIL